MIDEHVKSHQLSLGLLSNFYSQLIVRFLRIAKFGLQCIYANRRRTALSLLGIGIGLAAVVSLSMIGRSAQLRSLESFKHLPLDMVSAEVNLEKEAAYSNSATTKSIDSNKKTQVKRSPDQWQSSLEAKSAKVLGKTQAHWVVYHSSCRVTLSNESEQLNVATAEPGFFDGIGLQILSGRDFHSLDGNEPWVVLGSKIAQRMIDAGMSVELGKPFLLCGATAYIAGILSPSVSVSTFLNQEPDDTIFIRKSLIQLTSATPQTLMVIWRMASESLVAEAVKNLRFAFREYGEIQPKVRSAAAMLQLKKDQSGQYTKLLALLGGVSVLVGAFGIMNVMLIMVLERRYEIAVSMALGADGLDVGFQFLFESTILGIIGGLLGTMIAHTITLPVLYWLEMPISASISSSLLAIMLGALVGAISGLYPAWRVSRLDPSAVLAS